MNDITYIEQRILILAEALNISTLDIEGTLQEKYQQLFSMYSATQMRAEQMINELTLNGVEFGTCPWIESYTPDDAEYFATLLQQEDGYVNIL